MQVNFLVVFLSSQHNTMMDEEDISFSDLPTIYVKESDPYDFGLLLGRHFAPMIQSRATKDPILHTELLPFSKSEEGHKLIQMLSKTNSQRFPHHWDEMRGIADGSEVPFLEVLLLNFRKEVSPFLASNPARIGSQDAENCSDFLIASNNLTIIAHNEDADVSVRDHIFMVHASLPDHTSFVACTYAGELPTCAFGFNNYGVAFTLNAVPLAPEEVVAGGVGRNFISRDLLEATSLDDALKRVRVNELSAGHSYNIMDLNTHKVLNVESASMGRFSIFEATGVPFFHANVYLHLHVKQVPNESSIYRQKRAVELPKSSKSQILAALGDTSNTEYPIYMEGPRLCTLCTVYFDLHKQMMTIYKGNPGLQQIGLEFSMDMNAV